MLLCAPPGPAAADWREEVGEFRVGVVAEGDSAATAARAEPFRLALSEKLGLAVEMFPVRDYPALINMATRSRIEYGVFSATAYAAAEASCECLEPLVVAHSGDGAGDYRMVLVVPAASAGGLDGLRGRRIGIVRPGGTAGVVGGAVLALDQLAQSGFDISGGAAAEVAFADTGAAIAALVDGSIDALLGWSSMTGDPSQGFSRGTLRRMAGLGHDPAGFRIAWQSSPIPQRVHAIRKNLPGEAKTILRETLAAMFEADPVAYDSIEPLHGGGFLVARPSQFEALLEMFRREGITTDGATR